MSVSVENFIKTIYKYQKLDAFDTKPGSIAKALGISNAAATDMARKLAQRKLVEYRKYQPLGLTFEGEQKALSIIRKHRIWETFLFRVFDMSLLEIHKEAELLEHQTSDFLAEKLWNYLGQPTHDPHGDPIPTVEGAIDFDEGNVILYKADSGVKYEISRLINKDEEFFQFCNDNSIVQIINQYKKNKITELLVADRKILIPYEFACQVYVKK